MAKIKVTGVNIGQVRQEVSFTVVVLTMVDGKEEETELGGGVVQFALDATDEQIMEQLREQGKEVVARAKEAKIKRTKLEGMGLDIPSE